MELGPQNQDKDEFFSRHDSRMVVYMDPLRLYMVQGIRSSNPQGRFKVSGLGFRGFRV